MLLKYDQGEVIQGPIRIAAWPKSGSNPEGPLVIQVKICNLTIVTSLNFT